MQRKKVYIKEYFFTLAARRSVFQQKYRRLKERLKKNFEGD